MNINEVLDYVDRKFPDYCVWVEPFFDFDESGGITDLKWVPQIFHMVDNDGDMLDMTNTVDEAYNMILEHLEKEDI